MHAKFCVKCLLIDEHILTCTKSMCSVEG
jgi:hypothetical protein